MNHTKECDDDCQMIKNRISAMGSKNEPKPPILNSSKWKYEAFTNDYNNVKETCSRPEFIESKINNAVIGRSWVFNDNNIPCDALTLNKVNWTLNEGVTNNKAIDSKVVPFRSLPENTVVESFENNNVLTFNTGKDSSKFYNRGFEQGSKCCYKPKSKADYFQNIDETNLTGMLKILDYASGNLHHSNLNDPLYNQFSKK
jgi:hypothetical protein